MGLLNWLFRRHNTATPPAIVVDSIEEEYLWIMENFPGFEPQMHMLQVIDGRPYDVHVLRRGTNERTVLFDISSFYSTRP